MFFRYFEWIFRVNFCRLSLATATGLEPRTS